MNRKNLYKSSLLFFPIIFPFIFGLLLEDTLEDAFKVSVIAELAVITLFAFVFKRSFCVLFCQAGAVQRLANYAGSKLLKKRLAVPAVLDKYLRLLKYLLLAGLIIFSLLQGVSLIKTGMPLAQYDLLFPTLTWIHGIVGSLAIVGSLFVNNFFCKYLCVQGALFGIAGRLSPSGIVRHEDQCVNCQLCSKSCPQNLEVHKMSKVVSLECLNCQSCIVACPKKGALTNQFASRVIPFAVIVVAAVIFYSLVAFIVTRHFLN